ncbi:MAG: hypothetical protein WCP33_01810, partial [Deltaproteobacteria bacterium]
MLHDWEDIFFSKLQIPFIPYTLDNMYLQGSKTGGYDLAFIPTLEYAECFKPNRNTIPIIVDCWKNDVERFEDLCSKFPVTYVSNLQAYQAIINKGFSGNLRYMPLSVSDKHRSKFVPDKSFDVIQYGRKDAMLDNWMHIYLEKFPSVSYLTTKKEGDKYKIVSNHGDVFDWTNRQSFMDLLGMAKVSLVSPPGMDNIQDTGGYFTVASR